MLYIISTGDICTSEKLPRPAFPLLHQLRQGNKGRTLRTDAFIYPC